MMRVIQVVFLLFPVLYGDQMPIQLAGGRRLAAGGAYDFDTSSMSVGALGINDILNQLSGQPVKCTSNVAAKCHECTGLNKGARCSGQDDTFYGFCAGNNTCAPQVGCPFLHFEGNPNVADEGTVATDDVPGCKCHSICKARLGTGYTQDTCKCESTNWYGRHHRSKCTYPARPVCEKRNWEDKHKELWAKIIEEKNPVDGPHPLAVLVSDVNTSFDVEWDVMPKGRGKVIHPNGAVCPFTITISGSKYTGIFKDGESQGLIRLGSATPMKEGKGMTPGIGIKWLRTHRNSANFVALQKLSPLEDNNHDFFSTNLSNHLPPQVSLRQYPLAEKFKQASKCPFKVGLSDVCRYDQDGEQTEDKDLEFPYKVTFKPTGKIAFDKNYLPRDEFLAQFSDKINVGDVLYTLIAHSSPDDADGTILGEIKTTAQCTASTFGDKRLYFRHQRIEEDAKLRPQWKADDVGCDIDLVL